ncbi:MAG: helix-turn-helix domain-containing protein [Fibrobacteres bacterium]|nr:helix-turn-helix domain-containing protein [Fibrobacterota bacterium]
MVINRFLAVITFVTSIFANQDTLRPIGRLIDPAPISIITGNVIKFSVQAYDTGGSGIKEVRYYGRWHSVVDSTEQKKNSFRLIGRTTTPPFDLRWDCSFIPDQDNWRMTFYCDIEDSSGNIAFKAGGVNNHIVLDRKSSFSSKEFKSFYTDKPITIDGNSNDWPAYCDTLHFNCNNNWITALSAWDNSKLYFFIIVNDAQLWKRPIDTLAYWWYDGIELYLDPLRDRSSFRKLDDRQLDIHLSKPTAGNIVDFEKGVVKGWTTGFVSKIATLGTMNENRDVDSGYVIELAIHWDSLKVSPVNNDSLGFDLFNDDNDFDNPYPVTGSWAGTERSNNNNPSEWGTLILMPPKKKTGYLIIALLIAILASVFIKMQLRKRKLGKSDIKPEEKNQIADFLTTYLENNFSDPEMSLSKAANELRMSGSHLRHSLKKATGKSFSDVLRDLRLNKAREMLTKRVDMNVTQISIECGFSSLEYFTQFFKKNNDGQSPLAYRKSSLV